MSERLEELNRYKAELEEGLEEIKEEIKNVEKEIHFEGEDLGKAFRCAIENACDCDDCECNEEFDDECDYETIVDCTLGDELGILVEQCVECGDKIVTVQDLETGDMVELNRSQVFAILSLMEVE